MQSLSAADRCGENAVLKKRLWVFPPEYPESSLFKRKALPGPCCIIVAGIMWGTMGLWVRKFTAERLGSIQILSLRIAVTVVLMTVFLTLYNRKLLRIHLKDILCFRGMDTVESVAATLLGMFVLKAFKL